MKVGDKVYIFDQNHRVYPKDSKGFSGPIFREHFVEREILGETSRSWLVGYHGWKTDSRGLLKYSKKDCYGLFTLEQIDEEVYKHENAYKISQRVQNVDCKTLKTIAELIGYKEVVSNVETI